MLGQSSSESSGLLVSQVTGGSLALGVLTGLGSSLLVDHSQDLGDGLSDYLESIDKHFDYYKGGGGNLL